MNPGALHACTILLVDDEEANLDLLEAFLEAEGYTSLVRTTDARLAVPLFESHAPDLVLLDLHMPHRSGFEVLDEIRRHTPPGDYLPVLVLTADVTPEAKERALSGGARDFLIKPFDAVEVLLRVRNLLETRLLHRLQREAREAAEAAQARSALLAEASRLLAASLDGTTPLAHLPRLLVPRWADACAVLAPEAGGFAILATAHARPEREPAWRAGRLPLLLAHPAVGEALEGERVAVLPAEGVLVAPIRAQRRPAGALLLHRSAEDPAFSPADVEMLEDVAGRIALALENALLFAEAEWATRARERMLAVVAHDLRNPLSVVAMYSEMLLSMLSPEGDAYSRSALGSICEVTGRMQRLIEDLLDVAALQQGALSLAPAAQPLEPLLQEAERMLAPLAAAREISLGFHPGPAGDACAARTVRVDGARLLQVLSNLVGNALKFTPPGGRVEVRCHAAGELLRVSVADTGPGIAADQIPHIFAAFRQGEEADRRGVGLGLWIARAIVEAHGGRIWVESREGEGATFHFTLPGAAPRREARPEPLPDPWVG